MSDDTALRMIRVFAKSKRPQGHYRAGQFWPFAGKWADDVSADGLKLLRGDRYIVLETAKPLEEMTVDELRSYAAARGIDLGDAKKRDDILAKLQPPANG